MPIATELYPIVELSETEQDIILNVFDNNTVRKYLRSLGNNLVRDYLLIDSSTLADGVLAKHHQFVKGQLALLDTLCSIKANS